MDFSIPISANGYSTPTLPKTSGGDDGDQTSLDQKVSDTASMSLDRGDESTPLEGVKVPAVQHELIPGVLVVNLGAPQVTVVKGPETPKPISDQQIIGYCEKIYSGSFTETDETDLKGSLAIRDSFKIKLLLNLANCYKSSEPFRFENHIMNLISGKRPPARYFQAFQMSVDLLSGAENMLMKTLSESQVSRLSDLIEPHQNKMNQELQIMMHFERTVSMILTLEEAIAADPDDRELIYLYANCSHMLDQAMTSKAVSEHPIAKHILKEHVLDRIDGHFNVCKTAIDEEFDQYIIPIFQPDNMEPLNQQILQNYHEELNYSDQHRDTDPARHLGCSLMRHLLRQAVSDFESDQEYVQGFPGDQQFAMHSIFALFRNPSTDASNPLFGATDALRQILTQPAPQPAQFHSYRSPN